MILAYTLGALLGAAMLLLAGLVFSKFLAEAVYDITNSTEGRNLSRTIFLVLWCICSAIGGLVSIIEASTNTPELNECIQTCHSAEMETE